jgi:hypothetical protein
MPRRLGDDPLSRKRSPTTRENETPAAPPGLLTQETSHNDVFFRRRVEGPQSKPVDAPDKESILGGTANADERPEITEVADIVRTAQVALSTEGAERLAGPGSADVPAHPPVEEQAETTEPAPPTLPDPVPSFEPPTPIAEEPLPPVSSQPDPESQKSEGFFKRLFGRFGK